MNNDDKPYEGSTSVNGDVTPFSREHIDSVDALSWDELSTTELHDQRSTMQKRLHYAYQMGNPSLIKALEQGITQLDYILKNRPNGDNTTHML